MGPPDNNARALEIQNCDGGEGRVSQSVGWGGRSGCGGESPAGGVRVDEHRAGGGGQGQEENTQCRQCNSNDMHAGRSIPLRVGGDCAFSGAAAAEGEKGAATAGGRDLIVNWLKPRPACAGYSL